LASESEATEQFNNFSFKLQVLLDATENKLMTRDKLQLVSDLMRANTGWTCAHVAAKLGLVDCFTTDVIAQ
jgi:calcium-independent phospholipase A2